MKILLASLILSFSLITNALEFRIIGKNNEFLFSVNTKITSPTNVGEVSMDVFERFEIPFQGSAQGFSEIFAMKQDLEVISDTEMKAHGWCFSVDGLTPETMPDQTLITNSVSIIEWYYAYAHYKDGQWIGQCVR